MDTGSAPTSCAPRVTNQRRGGSCITCPPDRVPVLASACTRSSTLRLPSSCAASSEADVVSLVDLDASRLHKWRTPRQGKLLELRVSFNNFCKSAGLDGFIQK